MFAIIGGIGQQPVKAQRAAGLDHRRRELRRVIARSTCDNAGSEQMGFRVTNSGYFWPAIAQKAPIAAALHIMLAGMATFKAGGVDHPFGFVIKQMKLASSLKNGVQEAFKSPFFSSRFSA